MLKVEWCAICASRPAEGKLGLRIEGEDAPAYVYACEECALKALNKS